MHRSGCAWWGGGVFRVRGLRRPLRGSSLHRELNSDRTGLRFPGRGRGPGNMASTIFYTHLPSPIQAVTYSPRLALLPTASWTGKIPGLRSILLCLSTRQSVVLLYCRTAALGRFLILFSKANLALSLNMVEIPSNIYVPK